MKNCPNCNAEVEPGFEACWNCNYNFEEKKVIKFEEPTKNNTKDIDCIRCNVRLIYSGNFQFHEGSKLGVLGNLFELLVNKESFDIYICPKCGKAEFYIPS